MLSLVTVDIFRKNSLLDKDKFKTQIKEALLPTNVFAIAGGDGTYLDSSNSVRLQLSADNSLLNICSYLRQKNKLALVQA